MDYFLFNFSGVQFHYTMSHINNLLRNIINAGRENIKQNKMTVDLSNKTKKNNGWEF